MIMKILAMAICIGTLTSCGSLSKARLQSGEVHDVSTDNAILKAYASHAKDGTPLQAYEWKPKARTAKGAVVIVHGIRDHALRYAILADSLAGQGFAVYAQDMRGHARSGGSRQRFESIRQLVEDIDVEVSEVQSRNPGLPVFMYGHSLGGLVTAHYALTYPEKTKGIVLSGPALKLLPGIGGFKKGLARIFSFLIPSLPAQYVDDSQFVRELKAKAGMQTDSLIDHSNLPARSAAAALSAIDEIQKRMEEIRTPFLALHGKADKATNIEGSQELYRRGQSPDKTLKLYEHMFHDLMHEPERDVVISDVIAWLNMRTK
jgi:acylglycerol lipase